MSTEETPVAAAPAGEEKLSKNALKKKLKAEKAAAALATSNLGANSPPVSQQ